MANPNLTLFRFSVKKIIKRNQYLLRSGSISLVCLESKVDALSAKILGHVNHEHQVHGVAGPVTPR